MPLLYVPVCVLCVCSVQSSYGAMVVTTNGIKYMYTLCTPFVLEIWRAVRRDCLREAGFREHRVPRREEGVEMPPSTRRSSPSARTPSAMATMRSTTHRVAMKTTRDGCLVKRSLGQAPGEEGKARRA